MNTVKKIAATLVVAFKWLKSVVSEQDGLGSASRLVKVSIVGASIFCLVFVTVRTGSLPSAEQLSGLAKVIGMGSAAYAANQLKDIFSKDKDAS